MIGSSVKELLLQNKEHFITSDKKVAHVLDSHPVDHAFLILTKSGFSKIPVLNKQGTFEGFVSLNNINNAMFDTAEINPNKISELLVRDIMDSDVQILRIPFDIEDVLHLLVEHPFLPVVDDQQIFKGIVTRKEILKAINHLVHELENQYHVTPKNSQALMEIKV